MKVEIPAEREPMAFEEAPTQLRRLAATALHVVHDHDGDVSRCNGIAAMNFEAMAQDLNAWADRIEQGTPLRQRFMRGFFWLAERYDGIIVVPFACYSIAVQEHASAAMLLALAAWLRVGRWTRLRRDEQRIEAEPIPLSALLAAQARAGGTTEPAEDTGLYL